MPYAMEIVQNMSEKHVINVREHYVLSPETPLTVYNYIYFEDNTAYGAKYQ